MDSLGIIVAAAIIIVDLVAVVLVLRLGMGHDAHHDITTASSSQAVQTLQAQLDAAMRKSSPLAEAAVEAAGEAAVSAGSPLIDEEDKARKREEALRRKAARQSQRIE